MDLDNDENHRVIITAPLPCTSSTVIKTRRGPSRKCKKSAPVPSITTTTTTANTNASTAASKKTTSITTTKDHSKPAVPQPPSNLFVKYRSPKESEFSLDTSSSSSSSELSLDDSISSHDTNESPKRKFSEEPSKNCKQQKKQQQQPPLKKKFFMESPSSSEDEDDSPIMTTSSSGKKIISKKFLLSLDGDSDDELKKTLTSLMSTSVGGGGGNGGGRGPLNDSDDDDSSVDSPPEKYRASRFRKNLSAKNTNESKAIKPIESSASPAPIPSDKESLLNNLDDEADRNLQRLLWSTGCRYTLLSYQFRGVRLLAGVNSDYPSKKSKKHYTNDGWKKVLRNTIIADQDEDNEHRGLLMADVMGLGKTVQAVVACILRNVIAEAQSRPKKPTLVVSPNHAVTAQWADTLIKAGVPPGKIFEFVPRKGGTQLQTWHRNRDSYLLINRYQLQTEAKHLFGLMPKDYRENSRTDNDHKSPLFPNATKLLLCQLKNQYLSAHGLDKNKYRADGETLSECVTRVLSGQMRKSNEPFRTLVIDEAHFLKNLLAYWGLGAALLGLHSERVIPMTGTPYNNSAQDIATLMTFIDPSLESASEDWWKRATESGAPEAVARSVSQWNKSYMLRREKKVLGDRLKQKYSICKVIAPLPLELHVYEKYESTFFSILEKFSGLVDNHSANAMQRKKELFKNMISLAGCMRMALIHPVMPGGGRDWTINYSPTRRHLSRSLCNPRRCVCCKYAPEKNFASGKKKARGNVVRQNDILENLGDDQLMDDDMDDMEEEYWSVDEDELVELPVECCLLPNIHEGRLRHYAHEGCLETLGGKCPLCSDLCERAAMDSGKMALSQSIREAQLNALSASGVKQDPCQPQTPDSGKVKQDVDMVENLNMASRSIYCGDAVDGLQGFRGSAKIDSIISDFTEMGPDDKVLVLSFFKASLDLLEAIFFYELGVKYARFDGDLSAEDRQVELDRFKQDPDCKVLLMTVQTGGTGLNIVEANKCVFVDRWFNPFVHEQAEDRIYRLGQKRDVTITYHDVGYTIDQCMRALNEVKVTNANIVLADGSTTLSMASSGLSYKEMTGLLGNSVREVKLARIENITSRPRESLEFPMVPPPDMCDRLLTGGNTVNKDGFISKRAQPAFASIGDAMLHALGYATTIGRPKPTPSKTPVKTPGRTPVKTLKSGKTPDHVPSMDGVPSTKEKNILPPTTVFSSPASFPHSPSPMPDKCQSTSSKKPTSGYQSTIPTRPDTSRFQQMVNPMELDFSSDDDSDMSIPGPVFKR